MADIEYGPLLLKPWMKKIIAHKDTIYKLALIFGALTAILLTKVGYQNIGDMALQSTVITLDEVTYSPFSFLTSPLSSVDHVNTIPLVPKESSLNRQTQIQNIESFRRVVANYIESTGDICMHARYFKVPYDIIVFHNLTMINTFVVDESEEQKYYNEKTVNDTVIRRKRPIWMRVRSLNQQLESQDNVIWGAQTACFCHYQNID